MAVTKIWSIKKTLDKAMKYILDPIKAKYVYSYACAPETADLEFELTLDQNSHSGGINKAYHIIQSFKPEETTPEQAHEIGKQLLEQHLKGKYEYILTTHIDKEHIHNHVIFCASSFVEHKKYNDCMKTYYQLRETSDTLCAEHELSVILPNQNKGKSHYEWQMDQQGNSWKAQLRTSIDMCIKNSKTFEDFTSQMQTQGYEIKYGKHIAFRAEKQKRFTRAMQLGGNYTEENIKLRIAQKDKLPIKKAKKINLKNEPLSVMVALENNKKVIESKGYEHWAKLYNLKQNAKTLNLLKQYGISSIEEWEQKKISNQEMMNVNISEMKTVEIKLANIQFILKQLDIYENTKERYHSTDKQILKSDEQESAIRLYKNAVKVLKQTNMKPSKQVVTELRHQLHSLVEKKQCLNEKYKELRKIQKQDYIIEQNLKQLIELNKISIGRE
ncbi:relaxase/mobilization nuclease domain-containing protein [Listeria innocua]|nr:relaxase/mobilization nuclease domain-containing protein [Listeria monocytogenes]EKY4027613.1 relaxase/mobilization nuclease domain-containing protein [Listeria innocua]ELD8333492.1 relaxase/mobilization nuclease domain-containing protein [Listeria innocua]ELY0464584.1 relaxase/mobilization nuclease domain-containing protein [Listeria innocua]ELY0467464.1 relaxase/mobilization nuclease domain-containing protein [Listeria innocua]